MLLVLNVFNLLKMHLLELSKLSSSGDIALSSLHNVGINKRNLRSFPDNFRTAGRSVQNQREFVNSSVLNAVRYVI